jgi:hypothetical protein
MPETDLQREASTGPRQLRSQRMEPSGVAVFRATLRYSPGSTVYPPPLSPHRPAEDAPAAQRSAQGDSTPAAEPARQQWAGASIRASEHSVGIRLIDIASRW